MTLTKAQATTLWRIATSEVPRSVAELLALDRAAQQTPARDQSRATLQPVLNGLLNQGYLQMAWSFSKRPPRRQFVVTEQGRTVLEAEGLPVLTQGESVEVRVPSLLVGAPIAADRVDLTDYAASAASAQWVPGTVQGVEPKGEYLVAVSDPAIARRMRLLLVTPRQVRKLQ